jgi:hypothetical protein
MWEGKVRQTGAKSKAIKKFCTKVISIPIYMTEAGFNGDAYDRK